MTLDELFANGARSKGPYDSCNGDSKCGRFVDNGHCGSGSTSHEPNCYNDGGVNTPVSC